MAIVKVDEYYICKMVVSLWLVFGEFVSFPFGSSKVFPKNFYMMGTIAYFFGRASLHMRTGYLNFPVMSSGAWAPLCVSESSPNTSRLVSHPHPCKGRAGSSATGWH